MIMSLCTFACYAHTDHIFFISYYLSDGGRPITDSQRPTGVRPLPKLGSILALPLGKSLRQVRIEQNCRTVCFELLYNCYLTKETADRKKEKGKNLGKPSRGLSKHYYSDLVVSTVYI